MKKWYQFYLCFLFVIVVVNVWAQCPTSDAYIYKGESPIIDLTVIADKAAPMLWFSPDEPRLYDDNRRIQLPEILPFDKSTDKPVVYYKVKKIYSEKKKYELRSSSHAMSREEKIDLTHIVAMEIEYYFYYAEESGLGGHPHDLESVQLQLKVHDNLFCSEGNYGIEVKRVIARAHGLYWFENALNVDAQTTFPISILIEEGKHANCTDKNADGVYTPGFDVTEKVNDAWGVRDIISSGRLYSGGFQAWMAKQRIPQSLLLPPSYMGTSSWEAVQERFPNGQFENTYELRAFPPMPKYYRDKKLAKMVKSKKPIEWPTTKSSVSRNKDFFKLSKDNKFRNKVGFTYRWDEGQGLALSVPLLFVKHVEAPMTGGWFYNKFYFGADTTPLNDDSGRIFGHQIQHSTSASRWLDTYVGLGYEVFDENPSLDIIDAKTYLASEIGMKVRVNITKTPLKFLKFLGTDYWGIKFGWKNLGFNPFVQSGFVVEIGAGAF